MRKLTVGKNDAGKRADKFVSQTVKKLPPSLMQKYFRLKRIKVNGKAAKHEQIVNEGDVLELYINDEFFEGEKENEFLSLDGKVKVVYEDENIILADKPFGLIVHSDVGETRNTLINQIKAYLFGKGEYDPEKEQSFAPALCNRLDRNTGGIVIAAKNAEALRILNEVIKEKDVGKFYMLRVAGVMEKRSGELKSYLLKDEKTNTVKAYKSPVKGAKTAITKYKTVKVLNDGSSIVEAELLTGRTHQIRAQFAEAGHPLLGDGKYGKNSVNKAYSMKYQALYSYKVVFPGNMPGNLAYLSGKVFTAPLPDFLK